MISGVLPLRIVAGAGIAWLTVTALLAPALPMPAKAAAIAVMALTIWTPVGGLAAALALAPAGLLFAPPPARAAELMVSAFLTVWLLAVWRPLATARPDTRSLLPAFLYALCAVASWAGYTIGGAAGTEPLLIPAVVARAAALDHLVFSSPEPETLTLLSALAGLALFAAAATIARDRLEARRAVAAAIVTSAAVLSVLTIADVLREWANVDYGLWFLLRYVRGERFSLHLQDLNAAGSHYVLGGLIAVALAIGDRARRALWIALAIAMVPALWISGSRSASLGGLLVGSSLIPLVRRSAPLQIAPARIALVVALLAGVAVGGVVLASGPSEVGTASNALRLRSQFLVTSARMLASAPVFGVGIGHYHERSNEFMPPALREVYRHENAHNYFAQQFAELGLIGGALFVWLVVAVLVAGWREVRRTAGADAALLGLLAGTSGYLLTCVTGHPLLVPEAAMPFWGALGVLAGASSRPAPSSPQGHVAASRWRWATIAIVVAACVNVALQTRRYAMTTAQPGERGFYALEKAADGTDFVWMTRHGVFYAGPQPGTLQIPVRGPDLPTRTEPVLVAVDVGGRRAGVYEALPDRWTTIEIPIRRHTSAPFRRIDLRASQSWSPMRDRGDRTDDAPRSVMVGATRWMPAGGR